MTVTLPLWIATGQWVLLFALGTLTILLYRQLGYYLQLTATDPMGDGLPVGAPAAPFNFIHGNDGDGNRGRFEPQGEWSLLLFADPGCASCEQALLALEELQPDFNLPARSLVVTAAEPARIAAIEAFQRTSLVLARVEPRVPTSLYHTRITPFMFVIDPSGLVQAKGVATDRAAIEGLLRMGDRRIVRVVPVGSLAHHQEEENNARRFRSQPQHFHGGGGTEI